MLHVVHQITILRTVIIERVRRRTNVGSGLQFNYTE